MIHAYAICEPSTARQLPPRRGLGGARLRAVEDDGLAAVYTRHRSLEPSAALVLPHERVVEALMERGTVLPLRFGTRLADEQELRDAIASRRQELLDAIDRVRGRVEMGIRALPVGYLDDETDRSSGRAYLLGRAVRHHAAEHVARALHDPLATMATASVISRRTGQPTLLAASYLIDVDTVAKFRARAEELAANLEGIRAFVTGPWPPYNFVDLRDRGELGERG